MENIFENAKYGDIFIEEDGSQCLYIRKSERGDFFLFEQEFPIICNLYGDITARLLPCKDYVLPIQASGKVIKRYQEPIDEEKLDELATKALETTNPTMLLNKVEAFDLGFKLGYQKAKEN